MYMARARSCTQSVHGPGRVPCTWAAMYTGRKHGRVHHDTMHTRHRKSRQQKLVGRLLLKSNNSFSRNQLVYVSGSRDLLGHNVGHVIAHAHLTL